MQMYKVFFSALILGIAMSATITTEAMGGLTTPCLFGWHATTNPFDVVVNGSVAYVADREDGLYIFDVSDPRLPVLLGTWNIADVVPGALTRVWGLEHVGTTVYLVDFSLGLQIIDASDPTNPVLLGSYNTNGGAQGVEIVGNVAYIADGFIDGLQIIDISNPAAPTLLKSFDTPGDLVKVTVVGNLAYLSDRFDGIRILDITNPAAPVFLGAYDTQPTEVRDIEIFGTIAVTASGANGVQVFDVSNPAAPTLITTIATPSHAWTIDIGDNSMAYVTAGSSGVQVYDLSNPASPQFMGSFSSGTGRVLRMAVDGDLAYLADALTVTTGLKIMDLTGECPKICIGDLDDNQEINIFDFLAFLDAFNAMDPAADFTGDGIYDINDFFGFIDAFNFGCP